MDIRRPLQPNTSQIYLDKALRRGRVAADNFKKKAKGLPQVKKKKIEIERIKAISDCLINDLKKIASAYKSLANMSQFARALLETAIDVNKTIEHAEQLTFVQDKIDEVTTKNLSNINKQTEDLPKNTKGYIGRISGLIKKAHPSIEYLRKMYSKLRTLPVIHEGAFTVALAGFPNVGKSTLLSKITTATPEIQDYAFTTKGLNVGWMTIRYQRVQVIDTPGTLAREKRNVIEERAFLVVKYISNIVIFVIDPIDQYPLDKQKSLLDQVQKDTRGTIAIYISKKDIATPEAIQAAKDIIPDDLEVVEDQKAIETFIAKEFKRQQRLGFS